MPERDQGSTGLDTSATLLEKATLPGPNTSDVLLKQTSPFPVRANYAAAMTIDDEIAGRIPRKRERPAVRIVDVARAAGVSAQSVSRVLNDYPHVSPRVRLVVLAAIERLQYRPNSAARALSSGRSRLIGVVGAGLALHGPTAILQTLEAQSSRAGYLLVVAAIADSTPEGLSDAVGRLSAQGVDGVIFLTPGEDVPPLPPGLSQLPIVALEGPAGADYPTVCVDNTQGARAATEYLIGLGHKNIAHVSGPQNWPSARGRLRGWASALKKAGLRGKHLFPGDWSERSGYETGTALLEHPEITAVLAANDHMALGVLRALHQGNRRIPDDISVIGFDDVPSAAYYWPPLTTVRQDFEGLGERLIHLLLRDVGTGTPATDRWVLKPELIVRLSSGPARRV